VGAPFRRSARYYDAYYGQILDYPKQCGLLERLFERQGLKATLSILDIACGTGTHCLELAGRGHGVVGVDISPEMIEEARRKASSSSLAKKPAFVVQDMRKLHLGRKFDVAICMFGGYGYLDTDQDLARFFTRLSRHLNPGGLFLFEFWNIGGLKDSPYRTWRKAPFDRGAIYLVSESNFDHQRGILRISMEFIVEQGGSIIDDFIENHEIRIYSLSEMRRLLSANGYQLLEAFDERGLESFSLPSKDAFRIFAVARCGRRSA
jgi:SAM-dependent methyltransferase